MRHFISRIILCPLLIAPLLSGCILAPVAGIRGSGNVEEEIRPAGEFDTIELNTITDVFIQFSDTFLVRVEAEDNLLPHIQTRVAGNSLVIDMKKGSTVTPLQPMSVFIWLPSLKEIRSSSTGDITIRNFSTGNFSAFLSSTGDIRLGDLRAESVKLISSSAGDITILSLTTELLEARLSSTGDITIQEGTVQHQTITISSTGNYAAGNLVSTEADMVLSSTGNAAIQASDSLRARLSGTGDLTLIGSPSLDIQNSGVGEVQPLE